MVPVYPVGAGFPKAVAVGNREASREADFPEGVGRLFQGEAVALAHEPLARGLGGRERRERRLEGPLPAGPESVPRRDEVCGLVVVEPDAGTEELRDRGGVPAEEEAPRLQTAHRGIGRPRLRLDREDTVRDLLEEPLVGLPPHPPELLEALADRIARPRVLPPEVFDLTVPRPLPPTEPGVPS